MEKMILILLLCVSGTITIAQKKLVPVNQSLLTGISLPTGSKKDNRMLSVSGAKLLLEMESKKANVVLSATEVLVLPPVTTSGFDADSLIGKFTEIGWIISGIEGDSKYAWLQKDSRNLIVYFSMDAKETALYFGEASPAPIKKVKDNNTIISPPAASDNNQPTDNTEAPAVIGKWLKSSTSNSDYSMNNGLHQYHKMQYEFNANGTYSFLYRSFSYLPDIYFGKEYGTYRIEGNTITIIPQASVLETWSKGKIRNANGSESEIDKLGKLKSRQNRTLEKVTYQFSSQYFSGINEWQLVLQLDHPTERDGPYNGGTSFANAWLYGTAKYPFKVD
jgi:hypothetical protein